MLKFKIGAKVMLTGSGEIHNRLINGQTINIRHFELTQGNFVKIYVKFFDEKAGLKAMRFSYLSKQISCSKTLN